MGMRAAINAMCRECIYDPAEAGTWRKQVENCTCTDCPLYGYRPKSAYSKTGQNTPQNEQETASERAA